MARHRYLWVACLVLGGLVGFGCVGTRGMPPLETVPRVDLDRYLGAWYEIARYPHSFQAGCVASTATYSALPDGRIRVENQCRVDTLDGPVRRATGVAWAIPADASNARLEVQFWWPLRGDYWIIALDPDYRYAVVGHPSREYLWILARHPQLESDVYQQLLGTIAAQGYDLRRLERTLQPTR